MPIYLLKCKRCLSTFELQLKMSEYPSCCPVCRSTESLFEKLPTAFATKSPGRQNQKPKESAIVGGQKSEAPSQCENHHEHHDHHASCKKGYIDKLVRNYDKSLK